MSRLNDEIIVNKLRNMGDRIIHRNRIKEVILDVIHSKEPKKKLELKYLRRKGWIQYIFKGYYYLLDPEERYANYTKYTSSEMLFAVLNILKVKWYLGLETALEYNKIVWQGHSVLVILNNKFSGRRTIQGTKVQFKKIKKKHVFGQNTFETKNRIVCYYSDIDKTLVDFAYFNKKPPNELIEMSNSSKVREYLEEYSKTVHKRMVY